MMRKQPKIWSISRPGRLLVSISNDHRLRSCVTRKCHAQFWIGGGESDLSADHTFNETLSGVPQGSIVSPILANILLDKLDTFVEKVLIPKYTRGAKRGVNPEYHNLMVCSWQFRKQGNTERAEELKKQAQTLPSKKTDDPNYRRLRYVRYADDFLLGFVGPRSEAEEIKQQLRAFLQEELKLELSEEKTLITHAKSEGARFLGYEVTTLKEDTKRTLIDRNGVKSMYRSINGGIGLRVPKDVTEEKCKRYMSKGKAIHRKEMEQVGDYEIVMTYQLEYRGSVEYYRLAHNIADLGKLKWIMEISLTKTLAAKHKMSVSKVHEKYGTKLVVDDKEYKVLQASIPRANEKPLVATWGGIPLKRDTKAILQEQPKRTWAARTELERRLLAEFCELCGNKKDVEVHHVQAMRKLHEYPGRPKPPWVVRMIALKRKTLLLCRRCHNAIEHGLPITWPLISLEEIKDRRKRAILESRMQ